MVGVFNATKHKKTNKKKIENEMQYEGKTKQNKIIIGHGVYGRKECKNETRNKWLNCITANKNHKIKMKKHKRR